MENADDEQIDAPVKAFVSDDEAIAYTQKVRKELVTDILKCGMPSAEDTRKILLQTLDGIDRTALGNKKIKADEKVAGGMAGMAGMVAHMLTQISTKTGAITVERELPALGSDVETPTFVPGELGENETNLNYDTFMVPRE